MCVGFGTAVVKGWSVTQIIGVIILKLPEIGDTWVTEILVCVLNWINWWTIHFIPIHKILMELFWITRMLNRVEDCITNLFYFMWVSEHFRTIKHHNIRTVIINCGISNKTRSFNWTCLVVSDSIVLLPCVHKKLTKGICGWIVN